MSLTRKLFNIFRVVFKTNQLISAIKDPKYGDFVWMLTSLSKLCMLAFWGFDHIIALGRINVFRLDTIMLTRIQLYFNFVSVLLELIKYGYLFYCHARSGKDQHENTISILKYICDIPSTINGMSKVAPINNSFTCVANLCSAVFSLQFTMLKTK